MKATALRDDAQVLQVLLRLEQLQREQLEVLRRLELHQSSARGLSMHGSAPRTRKYRENKQKAASQRDAKVVSFPSGEPVTSVTARPGSVVAVASSKHLKSLTTDRCAAPRDFNFQLRQLHGYCDQVRLSSGDVSKLKRTEQSQKAKRLLRQAGSLEEAKRAVDRFAKFWRDDPGLHAQDRAARSGVKPWTFSFRYVLFVLGRWKCGCARLRERNGNLRYVPEHADRNCPTLHPMRDRAQQVVMRPPAPTRETAKKQAVAALRNLREQLNARK